LVGYSLTALSPKFRSYCAFKVELYYKYSKLININSWVKITEKEKFNNNKHCCVLSNAGLSNATSKRPKFVEKRGNYCRDTAKFGIRTPLKSDIYFRFVTETI